MLSKSFGWGHVNRGDDILVGYRLCAVIAVAVTVVEVVVVVGVLIVVDVGIVLFTFYKYLFSSICGIYNIIIE